jgi:transposase-like protein
MEHEDLVPPHHSALSEHRYAAVDPETNGLLHTKRWPETNGGLACLSLRKLRTKHDVEDAEFLVDDSASLKYGCRRYQLDFRYEPQGNRNNVERVLREVKRRTDVFSTSFSHARAATADEWLRSFAFAWNQLI